MNLDAGDRLVIAPEDRRRTVLALIRSALSTHGRLRIIDQATAVIGGIALRTASLQSGRQLAFVIHDPAAARQPDAFWLSLPSTYAHWQPPQAAIQEIRP
jgi:hypothetical protein